MHKRRNRGGGEEEESSPAQKGGTPDRRIYNITPMLHISTSGPYFRFRTSGAM